MFHLSGTSISLENGPPVGLHIYLNLLGPRSPVPPQRGEAADLGPPLSLDITLPYNVQKI